MPDQPPKPPPIVGLRHLAHLRSGRFIRIDKIVEANVDTPYLHVHFDSGGQLTLIDQEKDDVLELLAMHAGLQPAGPAIAVPDKTIIQP